MLVVFKYQRQGQNFFSTWLPPKEYAPFFRRTTKLPEKREFWRNINLWCSPLGLNTSYSVLNGATCKELIARLPIRFVACAIPLVAGKDRIKMKSRA